MFRIGLVLVLVAGCRTPSVDKADPFVPDETDLPDPTDTPVETDVPVARVADQIGFSAGGGRVETSRYTLRLSVGDPLTVETVETSRHQLRLGIGVTQDLP